MKTLLPSLALLLAPALAAALGPDIPLSDMGEAAPVIPVESSELPPPAPADGKTGDTISWNGQSHPKYIPMGPGLPGQIIGTPPDASAFNLAEIVVTADKKAVAEAKAAAAGEKKDPFLPDGMRWVPGCAHQGPPCRYEPDPSKVGPNDLVVADANGEKIAGAGGTRDAEAARKREAERQRQADPNGQYDPTGLGGIRRPPVVAADRVQGDNGASTVAGLIVDGWNDMGVGDMGSGPSSSRQANVVKGDMGDVVQVDTNWDTVQQSRGGLITLERNAGRQINLLERVAGSGPNAISAGNTDAEDGTQGCQRGQGGDMTPCLGVSKQ